ncbi:MAG: succinate dehydrogenase, cytochrome b556 subunit [Betaproteobacteria bacterium]|nr:succinate dehydrogenase, cytochrome b556 subunit [Betaproteobacteria bacterium]
MITSQRPKYLDLFRIRLPLPGLVSILHRISGTVLFVFAWALLYLLQESLQSPESHAHFAALTGHWLVKLFLIGMLWAFLHHFFAGLRFLLLDVHVASDLGATRAMSWAVLIVSLLLTAILGMRLW